MPKTIKWIDQVDTLDEETTGPEITKLAEYIHNGIPFPFAYVLPDVAYHSFAKTVHQDLHPSIKKTLDNNPDEKKELLAKKIKRKITHEHINDRLVNHITSYYENLPLKQEKRYKKLSAIESYAKKIGTILRQPQVTVSVYPLSSGFQSFYSPAHTVHGVRGESHLLTRIKDLWSTVLTDNILSCRDNCDETPYTLPFATIIQMEISPQKKGSAFIRKKSKKDKPTIIIQLEKHAVRNEIAYEYYEIDETTAEPVFQTYAGDHESVNGTQDTLTKPEIRIITEVLQTTQKHLYFPIKLDWGIERNKFYVLGIHPYDPTLAVHHQTTDSHPVSTKYKDTKTHIVLKATSSSPGKVQGYAHIISSENDKKRLRKGEVAVLNQFSSHDRSILNKAAGVIAEKGGKTSQLGVMCRELGIPSVTSAKNARELIQTGDLIVLDANNGTVSRK